MTQIPDLDFVGAVPASLPKVPDLDLEGASPAAPLPAQAVPDLDLSGAVPASPPRVMAPNPEFQHLNNPTPAGNPLWLTQAQAEIASTPGLDTRARKAVINRWQTKAQGSITPQSYDAGAPSSAIAQGINAVKSAAAEKAAWAIDFDSPTTARVIRENAKRMYAHDPTFLNQTLSAGGNMLVDMGLTGGAGGMVKGAAKAAGKLAFAGLAGAPAYARATEQGASTPVALAQGAVQGGLSLLPVSLAGKVGGAVSNVVGDKLRYLLPATAAATYAEMGATGTLGTGIENAIAQQTYDPNRSITDNMGEAWGPSAVAGAALFGTLGATHAADAAKVRTIAENIGNPDVALSARPKGRAGAAARYIAESTGKQVVWFDSDSPANAFYDADRIYVNTRRPQESIAGIVAHESIGHAADSPNVAAELQRLRQEFPEAQQAAEAEYAKDYAAAFPDRQLDPNRVQEEGTALFIERALRDPAAVEDIAGRYPGLWQRITRTFSETMDRIQGGNATKARLVREQMGVVGDVFDRAADTQEKLKATQQDEKPQGNISENISEPPQDRPQPNQLDERVGEIVAEKLDAARRVQAIEGQPPKPQPAPEPAQSADTTYRDTLREVLAQEQQQADQADTAWENRLVEQRAQQPTYTMDQLRRLPLPKLQDAARAAGVTYDSRSLTIPRILDAQAQRASTEKAMRYAGLTDQELYNLVKDRGMRASNRQANIEALTNFDARPISPSTPEVKQGKAYFTQPTQPEASQEGQPPKFDRRSLQQQIREGYKAEGGGVPAEAEQLLSELRSPFTFYKDGPYRGEIRNMLGGKENGSEGVGIARSGAIRLTDTATDAGGEDAIAAFRDRFGDKGEALYWQAVRARAGADFQDALDANRKSSDPNKQLMASLYDHLEKTATAPAAEVMPGSDLPTWSQFEMNGRKFRIIEDSEGNRMLKDGPGFEPVPADALNSVPVDKGTLKPIPQETVRKPKDDIPFSVKSRKEEDTIRPVADENGVGRTTPKEQTPKRPGNIRQLVEQHRNDHDVVGFRALHADEKPNIGDTMPPSAEWLDDARSDNLLPGTAAFADQKSPEKAFDLARGYFGGNKGNVALVGGSDEGTGGMHERGARLIGNAKVLAILDKNGNVVESFNPPAPSDGGAKFSVRSLRDGEPVEIEKRGELMQALNATKGRLRAVLYDDDTLAVGDENALVHDDIIRGTAGQRKPVARLLIRTQGGETIGYITQNYGNAQDSPLWKRMGLEPEAANPSLLVSSSSKGKAKFSVASSRLPLDWITGGRKPTEADDVTFLDKNAEARYRAARGIQKQGIWEQVKEKAVGIKNELTRNRVHLDTSQPEDAKLDNMLRIRDAQIQEAPVKAQRQVQEFVKDLTPAEYERFGRLIQLPDIAKDVEAGLYEGKELPFGFSDRAALDREIAHLEAKAGPKVIEAVKRRNAEQRKIAQKMVDLKLLPEDVLKDDRYYHRQVMQYMDMRETATLGSGGPDAKLRKKGFQKSRSGGGDYNTAYEQAEHEYLTHAHRQIATAETLERIKKEFDQTARLREEWGKDWYEHIPEGYTRWSPKAGTAFARVLTIPEETLQKILSYEKDLSEVNLREMFARIPGEQYVIPEHFATQLDETPYPSNAGWLDKVAGAGMASWKQWKLLNPLAALRYNVNNMSGDADVAMAADPRILLGVKKAWKDLSDFNKGKASPAVKAEIEKAMGLGVLGSGENLHEIPDISNTGVFAKLTGNGSATNPVKWYWDKVRAGTTMRENLTRLASYRRAAELIGQGKEPRWASKQTELSAIADPSERAAKLSRDLLGDYGNISHAGQLIRRRYIPFWSWMEINLPRYYRLFANSAAEGRAGQAGIAAASGAARGLASMTLKASAMYMGVHLFNSIMFPGEDDGFEDGRVRLLVGKTADGRTMGVKFEGAFADSLRWFGAADAPGKIGRLNRGEASPGDVAYEVGTAPINRLVNSAMPIQKSLVEAATGKALFPDVLHPRSIRDRGEHLARMVDMDMPYRAAKGIPQGSVGEQFLRTVVDTSDPKQVAYGKIRSAAGDWLEEQGTPRAGGEPTERSNALFYYKRAKSQGDDETASEWLQKYRDLGGTDSGMATSLKLAHPLAMIPVDKREAFVASLSPDQQKQLKEAEGWYWKTYHAENAEMAQAKWNLDSELSLLQKKSTAYNQARELLKSPKGRSEAAQAMRKHRLTASEASRLKRLRSIDARIAKIEKAIKLGTMSASTGQRQIERLAAMA